MGDGRGPRLPRRRALTKTALVLGAGGTVGLAYHAGVLRALAESGELDLGSVDLVVGTSAGSVMAAYLRSGRTPEDLWEVVSAATDQPPAPDTSVAGAELPDLFVAAFKGPLDLTRRGLGSAFVLGRSVVRAPLPVMPAILQKTFPAGLFEMIGGRRRFETELPRDWPPRATWLCAVDIVSGRRMVLGRRPEGRLSLVEAVMASCAIPGAYPPVRYGRRVLIDGGAHSTTNLDLAVEAGADLAVVVAPMAYDPGDPPGCSGRLVRRIPSRSLDSELARADRSGTRVFAIAPGAFEVGLHGVNFMRTRGLRSVAEAAYESTRRRLERGELARMMRPAQGRGRNPATTL